MKATNCCTGVLNYISGRSGAARWRLAGLASLLVLGALFTGVVVSRTWTRLEQLEREFVAMEAEGFYLGIRLRSGLERLNATLLRFQLSKADPGERERFYAEARGLTDLVIQTRPMLATASERQLVTEIETALRNYLAAAAPLLERGVKAVRRDTAGEISDQIHEIASPLRDLCERLVNVQKGSLGNILQASHQALRDLWQSSLFTLFILAGFATAIFVIAYRAGLGPLRQQLDKTRSVLERQEKLASLGTLAAGVAHEIRNPLASLKFRLFSLRQSLPGEFAANEDIAVIRDEIDRLERIVKDFLQFARPSEPIMGELTAQQLLQTVRDLLQPQLETRGVRLMVEAGERISLRADRQQIEQVLINLAQNAADSIDSGGTITLRAREGAARLGGRSTPTVILEVADTGKGISPEVQQRLFDPFFSTKTDGTGLGLPISERIVEKHGGLIQYHTQPKRGTVFQILLPRDSNHAGKNTSH